MFCSLFYQFLCRLGFFRGVRQASRETGHGDVILHGRQQQRGDGVNQHFTGDLQHWHKTKPVSLLSVFYLCCYNAASDDLLKPLKMFESLQPLVPLGLIATHVCDTCIVFFQSAVSS